MFTGIVETTAEILERSATGLVLARPAMFDDVKIGSSISVSGACLTITKLDQTSLHFDVVKETWDRTKLGSLHPGDQVNLERALAANGRFEGHVVQGHVEGVGRVVSFVRADVAPAPPSVPPLPGGEVGVLSLITPSPTPPPGGRGFTWQRSKVDEHVLRHARRMRQEPTETEAMLWDMLRNHRFQNLHFRRQYAIGRFILDFYCHEARLGIEIDGEYHDAVVQQQYDLDREAFLREYRDVRLFRVKDTEIRESLTAVLEKLRLELKKSTTLPSPVGEGQGEGVRDGQRTNDPVQHLRNMTEGIEEKPWYSALLTVELPPDLLPFVVFKGSITLDGVALTVAKLEQQMCTIALIPHTLAITTLGTIRQGDLLNVESDVLGRYVAAMLQRSSSSPHEA